MMGGFKNQHLNHIGRQRIFNTIVTVLIKSCSKMVSDCVASGEKLQNHEEKIRNYLLENYLSNDSFKKELKIKLPLLFIPEVPEKFIPCSNTYEGRIDIKVFSNDIFNNRNDYYIVECKRIDGTSSLYQKYVDEGIERFVADNPKYSSYNNNLMLGFVVKDIDISTVVTSIDAYHNGKFFGKIIKGITSIKNSKKYNICESSYINGLILKHIFYNLSCIIS